MDPGASNRSGHRLDEVADRPAGPVSLRARKPGVAGRSPA